MFSSSKMLLLFHVHRYSKPEIFPFWWTKTFSQSLAIVEKLNNSPCFCYFSDKLKCSLLRPTFSLLCFRYCEVLEKRCRTPKSLETLLTMSNAWRLTGSVCEFRILKVLAILQLRTNWILFNPDCMIDVCVYINMYIHIYEISLSKSFIEVWFAYNK